ncbi:High osmolarity signaling protein SHO1 [Psilocybe cubensis]|uniref:High osmolarity signaling protein SHO1 n=2 Tax=Psilocybe cubensis TaxID=181762 RepID=A0ACB8GZK4_PSICU|nr:High osmolarity signaling protein SHO1 [Psilocybe cubensis]KAH9480857.1 High osmolarity signaling protein SHO1 [Psilocybe cubensis]
MESRGYAATATESERPNSNSEVVVVDAPIPRDEEQVPVQVAANGPGSGNAPSGPISHRAERPRKPGSEVFLVGMFVLALIGWIISLVGQAVVAATISNAPVRILWFAIVLQTAILLLLIQVLSNASIYNAAYAYGTQISILAALATAFAVLGVDQNIYSSQAAQQATGAGWLITAIVDLLLIIFFTSPPQSPILRVAKGVYNRDRDAPRTPSGPTQNVVEKISRSTDAFHRTAFQHSGATGLTAAQEEEDQLEGLTPEEREKVERMVDEKMAAMGMYPRGFHPRDSSGASSKPRSEGGKLRAKRRSGHAAGAAGVGVGARGTLTSMSSEHQKSALLEAREGSARPDSGSAVPEEAASESPAKWRAEALFEYKGSEQDPNELAFKKGDKLLIYDKSGKWWEAETPDGRKGIAPSNYLKLV